MKLSTFERFLNLFLRHQDICDEDGSVYLRRWFIKGRNEEGKLTRHVYLHHFFRGDQDIDLHDHPWDFHSLILKGGYREQYNLQTPFGIGTCWQDVKPVRLIFRPAEWRHRVELYPGKHCWSLVFTSQKKRSWGFWNLEGTKLCPWRKYLAKQCWCGSN